MATTTPNYSWPVPTSTDLVKDGASAIEALGDAIDATLFAIPAATSALTLIDSSTFTNVASHSVNDVFSATYTNYKILHTITSISGAGAQLRLRLRVGGADNSASNYVYGTGVSSSAGGWVNNNASTGTTSFYIGDIYQRNSNGYLDIFSPFLTDYTANWTNTVNHTNTSATGATMGGGAMTVTTSYTGFTVFGNANNITGTVKVYGYQD